MAKESKYGVRKKAVFRETFNSFDSIKKNGGTPVAVTYNIMIGNQSAGSRTFNGLINCKI